MTRSGVGGGAPRVAFVLHVMQVAGAEVLVRELVHRLGRGIVPFVYCLDAVGPIGEALNAEGVPVVSFGRRPGLDWQLIGRMARRIREDRIDILHAHQYTPFFYAALAARRARPRPRVVFTEHGRHYPDAVGWKRRLVNRLYFDRIVDEITAVCAFSADALAANDGFTRSRIKVIPNGIDVDHYLRTGEKDALRNRLDLDPARRYVVIVARFHPVKDHATLIRAFARVAAQQDDVDLLLVGDGPLRPDLEAQIAGLGLQHRVRLTGVRRDVADWLKASDIFVLCSVSEAASITLLEAMATGLPAVVTEVGGNPELVRGGIDGLHVPRGDDGALAEALLALLVDERQRLKMGVNAAARVRREFHLDTTVEAYGRLLGAVRLTRPHTTGTA